jgi:hypothetical protein
MTRMRLALGHRPRTSTLLNEGFAGTAQAELMHKTHLTTLWLNSTDTSADRNFEACLVGMFTTDQYAASVVEKYRIIPDTQSVTHRAADDLMPILKQWGKQYLLGITLSGAYAKNTAISLSAQVDILIALSPVPGMDLKRIFWSLFEFLSDRELRPRTRNVCIEVEHKGVRMHVIPACPDAGTAGNVLFNKRSGSVIHTDVAQHVHLVANSGRQQEICALKIWRERNQLEFPSLYLELSVLRALERERFGQLADNVMTAFHYLAGRFEKTAIRDPANSDNVVSDDLGASEKQAIAKVARKVLDDENWKSIVW